MQFLSRYILLFAVSLFSLGSGSTRAADDNLEFVPRSELEALQRRFDEYDRRLAAAENNRPAGRSFCYPCATQSGATAGAEITWLKPFHSEGEAPGFDHDPAARLWVGYTGDQGLGVRARWFEYENLNPENVGVPFLIESFDLTMVDVEVTDKFKLGHWEGLISGGLRYADYKEFGFFDADQMTDSLGPVIGLELTRCVNDRWSLFGIARTSLQFADHGLDNDDPVTNLFFSITEIQLGAERTLRKVHGGHWLVPARSRQRNQR